MARNTFAQTIFCESIREEKSGQDTLVGVMPDYVNIPTIPGAFGALSLYTRISFDPKNPPKEVHMKLLLPDGKEIPIDIQKELIPPAVEGSLASGHPLATLVSKATTIGMPVTKLGHLISLAFIDGEQYVAGALTVTLAPKPDEASSRET